MTNITELKDPASLERLLDDLGEELERQGEPPECIGYVSWAISGIHHHCKLSEVIQVQESEMGAAIALKEKVNALLAELIQAHVWIWHCGGSEGYGFSGPGRKSSAREVNRSDRKAPVFTLYKNEEEGADNGR